MVRLIGNLAKKGQLRTAAKGKTHSAVTIKGWFNVYWLPLGERSVRSEKYDSYGPYSSQERAYAASHCVSPMASKDPKRIACICRAFHFKKGEGLQNGE